MILSRLAPLLVLPFAVAEGIQKLKLHKLPPAASNPTLEGAYLAEKYGASVQTPIVGSGGFGRNIRVGRPAHRNGEDLFWTQDEFNANGGHGVPLSSMR